MPAMKIITRNGDEVDIQVDEDLTIMEAVRDNDIDEIAGLCGGQLSCATCHVYISPEYADKVTPISDYEDELLKSTDHRKENSRLGCQIKCDASLDGITITVAPED